jgi:hypothetical protein
LYSCSVHGRFLATGLHATLLPPSGYSSQIAYRHTPISSFSRAVHFRYLLSFLREPTPQWCPVTHFPQPKGNLDCSLYDLQSMSLADLLVECPLAS